MYVCVVLVVACACAAVKVSAGGKQKAGSGCKMQQRVKRRRECTANLATHCGVDHAPPKRGELTRPKHPRRGPTRDPTAGCAKLQLSVAHTLKKTAGAQSRSTFVTTARTGHGLGGKQQKIARKKTPDRSRSNLGRLHARASRMDTMYYRNYLMNEVRRERSKA